jgi:uncharacterized protein (TIGR03067 family)
MAANPQTPRRAAGPSNGPPPPPPPAPEKAPQEPRRKVVVVPSDHAHSDGTSWVWAILAVFVSLIFHGGLIAALLYLPDVGQVEAREKTEKPLLPPAVDPSGLKALEGTWFAHTTMQEGTLADVPSAQQGENGLRMIVTLVEVQDKGKKLLASYKVMDGGDERESGSITIDAGKDPKTIDFAVENGAEKGKTTQAVYEVDLKAKLLRVAYPAPGKDRPATFEGKGAVVYTYSLTPKAPTPHEEEKKEDEFKPPDLTDLNLGDPMERGPTTFDNERIEPLNVPGAANFNEMVGVVGAPELSPRDVPPPPGTNGGQGAAPLGPDPAGTSGIYGTIGGYQGGTLNANHFAGRSGATKEKLLQIGGGNKESEACVAAGLYWLAHHQAQDGHWSMHEFQKYTREKPFPAGKVVEDKNMTGQGHANDVAATAMALLPFLAAGQTHKANREQQSADYSKGINAGLDWLIKQQGKDGSFPGGIYAHGIASIVLCEAYGLTSDPILKLPAQRALDYIVLYQHKEGGGWRYTKNQPGDLSVSGWQLMALKSGQMSGLRVPPETLKGAERFVDSSEDPNNKGCYSYVPGGGRSPAMTATGMLCRQYLGINPRSPKLLAGVQFIKSFPPAGPGRPIDMYYEYYATQVMHHMGGDAWEFWNLGPDGKSGIRDTLIAWSKAEEQKGPTFKGSFMFQGGHTASGGRIMCTSLALLSLEVYYRHLPLYRSDLGVVK